MSTVVHTIDAGKYLTIRGAADYMGCSDAYVRYLIRNKRLRVRKISERVQLVQLAAADKAREALTTRSKGKRSLAKRPAAGRKQPRPGCRRHK